jgi:hypothetical protein
MLEKASRRVVPSVLVVILAVVLFDIVSAPARTPQPSFDGQWSVVIITDSGPCDRAYRYGVRIAGGRISYRGEAGVTVAGQVDGKGKVSVTVRSGSSSAEGSGQLADSTGEGMWQGASTSDRCSGRWQAERRE